ncbi:MAG: hypothetical protein AB1714_22810 [Acidobacteriota bacterium]
MFNLAEERERRLDETRQLDGEDRRKHEDAVNAEFAIPVEAYRLGETLIRFLAKAPPEARPHVFIDALDQLPEDDPARRLAWLPSELPPNLRLVLSVLSNEPPQTIARRLPTAACVRLGPMPSAEGGALLDRWLASARRTLQPQQRHEVLVPFQANGLPLYLRVAFEEARRWRSFTPSDQTVLGNDVQGVIHDLLARLEADHGRILLDRTLSLLAASRDGLSEDEILDLLSRDADIIAEFKVRSPKSPDLGAQPRLPTIVWSRLHHDLEPYLSERAAEGATVLSFYHRQLSAAASKRYLTPDERRLTRHGDLASYFARQPLASRRAGDVAYNRRKCWEQPRQELKAECWEALEATLTDIEFVEAKSRAGMVYDLLRDYAEAERAWPGRENATREEQDWCLRMSAYGQALMEYSRANTAQSLARTPRAAPSPLPVPPLSVARATEPQRGDVGRAWTPFGRVDAWSHFAANHTGRLASGFEPVFQIAYNSAVPGPRHDPRRHRGHPP